MKSYVDAQARRQDGKLRGAREAMVTCANEACPAALRDDCTKWVREVERTMPTVVLEVRGPEGQDRVQAKVTLDGEPFEHALDGKAHSVDPGIRVLRVEIPGYAPIEQRVTIREGEKSRRLTAEFRARRPAGPHSSGQRPTPPLVYVLGAAGIAGIGAFTYFGLSGRYGDPGVETLGRCRPDCHEGDVREVNTKFVVADVALGVAVLSLGAAAIVYLTRPTVPSRAPATTGEPQAPRPREGKAGRGSPLAHR